MALEDIFSLFGFSEEGKEDLKKIEIELDMFKDTPHFKLGMFHKLIMNGSLFSKQVLKLFSKGLSDELCTTSP